MHPGYFLNGTDVCYYIGADKLIYPDYITLPESVSESTSQSFAVHRTSARQPRDTCSAD